MTMAAAPTAPTFQAGRRGGPVSGSESLESEIEAMMSGALRWVDEHLDEFDPFKGGRPFEMRHGQKIAELATMLHCYVELTGDEQGPEVRRILDLVRTADRNRELTDRLLRSPAELVLYCILYVVLRARGHDDPDRREVLQRAVDAGLLGQTERVVHRQMDISLHLEWAGLEHSWPCLEDLCAASILGQGPCPLYLDENAVYALTHVLMFLYGFGLRQPARDPGIDLEELQRLLSRLLIIACQEHHWDLLGELLLCWDCAGLAATPVSVASWRALLSAQEPSGAVPGPETALPPGRTAANPPLGAFAHRYHTTLVCIIAGALRLNRSRSGRVQQAPLPACQSNLPAWGGAKPAAQRARRWLDALFATAEAADQPEMLCRILVGRRLCGAILGEEPETADGLDRELVLSTLGLPADPEAFPAEAGDGRADLPLTASREEVEELARHIQTATACGTRSAPPSLAEPWLSQRVIGLAMHALRQYNLLGACKLLRAAAYLGAGEAACRECLDFLCLHQRPDGAFGYFGPEERKIAAGFPQGFSADLHLYLPVTLSCLWTLAECGAGGWRLWKSPVVA